MNTLCDQLVAISDIFGKARGVGRKRISTIVLYQGSKLDAVANGLADVTTKTWERAMQYYSDHWPENIPWPNFVVRPQQNDEGSKQQTSPLRKLEEF